MFKISFLLSLILMIGNIYADEKELEPIEKFRECQNKIKDDEIKIKDYINKYYFQNLEKENDVISFYNDLKRDTYLDFSILPDARQKRLYENENFDSYYNTLINEYELLFNDLESDRISETDFEKQFKVLMFAFVVPYEILSTKKIYENSLFEFTPKLYENLTIKNSFYDYANNIYTLIPNEFNINLNYLSNSLKSNKKDIDNYCLENYNKNFKDKLEENLKKINENYLNKEIKDESLEKFLEKTSSRSIIFEDIKIKNNRDDLIKKPLQDTWYVMVRKYTTLQDKVYDTDNPNKISVIKKIDDIIKKLNEKEKGKIGSRLKLLLDEKIKLLMRKLIPTVRYNIFDLPVSIYADIYLIKFNNAKSFWDDDEDKIEKLAILYNKSIANLDKCIISGFAKDKTHNLLSEIKGDFNDKEWENIVKKAKMDQNWLDQIDKIKIDDKGDN